MTRVVVIGPYPPTADPAGDVTLALVRRLRDAGATVAVVSPTASAAAHHGDPATWAGARRVARVVRGAGRVVWFTAPGDAAVGAPLRRTLATVPRVEHHPTDRARDLGGRARDWRARLERVRAGGPTFVRTFVGTVVDRARLRRVSR